MNHPNEDKDLEDLDTYSTQMVEAMKLGPKYCEALRVQRNDQVAARIAAWKSQQPESGYLKDGCPVEPIGG